MPLVAQIEPMKTEQTLTKLRMKPYDTHLGAGKGIRAPRDLASLMLMVSDDAEHSSLLSEVEDLDMANEEEKHSSSLYIEGKRGVVCVGSQKSLTRRADKLKNIRGSLNTDG